MHRLRICKPFERALIKNNTLEEFRPEMVAEINYFDKCSTFLREQGLKCKIMA